MTIPTTDVPALLEPAEAARRIRYLAEGCAPHIGAAFLDPIAVLAIAGVRGIANLEHLERRTPIEELQRIEHLLDEYGLFVRPVPAEDAGSFVLSLLNPRGLEWVIARTAFALPRIDRSWEHARLVQYMDEMHAALDDDRGFLGRRPTLHEIGILGDGVCYGYPDQAIRDYVDLREAPPDTPIEQSWIELGAPGAPGTRRTGVGYDAYGPEFLFFAAHRDDPGIRERIETCHGVLDGVRTHPWYRRLLEQPGILTASRRRVRARRRLGLPVR